MKAFSTLLLAVLSGTLLHAQPSNDDCGGAISLGSLPACPNAIFTNIGATTSNIGTSNNPNCFNGGNPQRDVWFSFVATADIRDVSISLTGATSGANNKSILNPQIAAYRGTCTANGLSQIGCISALPNDRQVRLDVLDLDAGETYYIRVNDYSPTATPNSGDFTICIEEYVPAINMGDAPGSNACFGTLYDSGGPTGNYGNNENLTFTINPSQAYECLEINLLNFSIEPGLLDIFGDILNFYAGTNTNGPLIASVLGVDANTPFTIQASGPITIEFQSDFIATFQGFELTWQCSSAPCDNQSIANPIEIPSLPFTRNGLSTCESASTFGDSPCVDDEFLGGPEVVFAYVSEGGICINVQVTGAAAETGVLILDGLPNDPTTNCVARSASGNIVSADLRTPGTYYIVVANRSGCTPFNINVQEATCAISPALVDALCNPLNGCVRIDGLPTVFNFEDGFLDLNIEEGVNSGCWRGFGIEPNFYWFTIQSQADGPFGFLLNSADIPSDLDFNVWGPFTQEQVCGTPTDVISFIQNNQPIRSSWSPTPGVTGITDQNPITGAVVRDDYDCGNTPGAGGDDFVRRINTRKGEVYVVLINDWGNLINETGVTIDWSPSFPPVLEQIPVEVVVGDTAICQGESVQIKIETPVNAIQWLNDTNTLSCDDCPNPIATPSRTTTYRVAVDAVCYSDTISVTVEVFDVDLGEDRTVCRNEQFEIEAGSDFENASYQWIASEGIQLSCTDCPVPTITVPNAGTFNIIVVLTAPTCTLRDTARITVLPQTAPQFTISDDVEICEGDVVSIGGPPSANVSYSWTSNPPGFSSNQANPQVSPAQTITYYLSATNTQCPVASVDSVLVTVFEKPVLSVANDTSVCQEEPIVLGNTILEEGVTYSWSGPDFIEDDTDPNSIARPANSGAYTLTATRGACEVSATLDVTIIPIALAIQAEDTIGLCKGTPLVLNTIATPTEGEIIWIPNDGSLSSNVGRSVTANPAKTTTYIASIAVSGCVKMDTVVVVVDSLPSDLLITPSDTTVCEGSLVLLKSTVFEPSDFPNIEFRWLPSRGQITGDSLYNMVLSPDTTNLYFRIATNGVCVDTSFAQVNVIEIPDIRIEPADTTVCIGEGVKLKVISPVNLEKLEWMPMTNISCTMCLDPVVTPPFTTQYAFSAEFEGCPVNASANVNVYPVPAISLNSKREICLGESIQLNGAATPGATYTWTSSTDPNFRSNNPLLSVTPTQTTTYTLLAQVADCQPVQQQLTITVVQPADVTIAPLNPTICKGESITLTATGTAPVGVSQTYFWQWNGQSSTNQTIVVNNIMEDTEFRLTYVYGNNCGVLTKSVTVDVQENVIIERIEIDPDIYEMEPVPAGENIALTVVTTPSNPEGATYMWTANGEPISGNAATVQHRPVIDSTVYLVKITSPNGCISEASITVSVQEPEVAVPSAFTPNNDGRNDFFNLVYRGMIDIIEFKIFNRWGQLVYDNENEANGWDGKHNGNPAPSDVYAYIIIYRYPDGREFTVRGDVTLIR